MVVFIMEIKAKIFKDLKGFFGDEQIYGIEFYGQTQIVDCLKQVCDYVTDNGSNIAKDKRDLYKNTSSTFTDELNKLYASMNEFIKNNPFYLFSKQLRKEYSTLSDEIDKKRNEYEMVDEHYHALNDMYIELVETKNYQEHYKRLKQFLTDCGFYFADSENCDELSDVNVYTYLFDGDIKTLSEKLGVLYRTKANENKTAFDKFCADDKAFIMYADKDVLGNIKKQNDQRLEKYFEFEDKSELVK